MYTLTGEEAFVEEFMFKVFGYVILKPAPLENVVLLPIIVCVAEIGVGDGLVFVAQPAAVTVSVISAAITSTVIRLRLSMESVLAYMDSFCTIKVCIFIQSRFDARYPRATDELISFVSAASMQKKVAAARSPWPPISLYWKRNFNDDEQSQIVARCDVSRFWKLRLTSQPAPR